MKVNEIQRTAPIQAYQKIGGYVPREDKRRSNPQDHVEISEEAKRMADSSVQKTGDASINSPDPARLDALRQAVQEGTYQVNARQVAEKIANDWFGK